MSLATVSEARHAAPLLRKLVRSVGLFGLSAMAILAAGADVFARAPVGEANFGPALAFPSAAFPFGTDEIGRDVLSETLHALAHTASHAFAGMLVAVLLGELAGFAVARFPRIFGGLVRWMAEVLGAVPTLLLAILAIATQPAAFAPLAAGLAATPLAFGRAFDRAAGGERSALADYARMTGIPGATLFRRDFAYEFRDRIFPIAARAFAAVTITLSTASFLGFGIAPPARGLGLMIGAARQDYLTAWWTAAFPALALVLLVLFARLGAGLEEGERP
jgi:peptide/nickel transport system permease protein